MNLLLGDVGTHDGFVSVDLRPEADVQADVRHLPYADESVDSVVALDLIEHFRASETQALLAEWFRVLRPSGTLTVKCPNMGMIGRWIADGYKVRAALRNVYGGFKFGPDGEWDAHKTGWDRDLLIEDLTQAGFVVESCDTALNMTARCRRP